jgi:hypothetical protein
MTNSYRRKLSPKLDFNLGGTNKAQTNYAYIAGLFDGEGCVSIYKHGTTYAVSVAIEMRDPQAIKFISSLTGIKWSTKTREGEKNLMYYIRFSSFRASYKFLSSIYPYLKVKKTQARIALNMMKYKKDSPFVCIRKLKSWAKECKRLKRSGWAAA